MKKVWHVSNEREGRSIKEFLLKEAQFSRQIFKLVKKNGQVTVNGEEVELWKPLKSGDEVTVFFPLEERGSYIKPEAGPLSIVYEDEDLLVIDKPSDIAVIPSIDKSQPCIANRILHHYDKQGISSTVHIVTRLDRNTSGLMVIAKHAYGHMLLTRKEKLIDRHYKALVQGFLEFESGTIEEPISRVEGSIIRRTVSEIGKPSKTLYEVEERYSDCTLVRLQLMTGRTHQIRVHMAHIGHPLIGDTLYGGVEAAELSGQALHCAYLKLIHPWTKEELTFTSDPPAIWEKYK
ncbi:RluA family pseudouridine synthase [Halobacillus yeomjeoni]|uniref:Pseudouridine synthase n=1 Tax=Halobacillus yeomjeoni TaxID=311194 RepID=A0A931HSI7_9BACI|nr:RluA family pseudouridine synthase [Halobacillus yeomjeoni]MBH0228805.1 RluA family pseudouridine synthase [Halobacillus yeomjeoni]